jgi:glycosyltransferase involved in cell wall biosynthesis
VNADWCPDAYCGKALRLCRILTNQGHHVTLYGGSGDDTAASEHVTVVTEEDRQRWFGDTDWGAEVFNQFDPVSAPWLAMNSRTAAAMQERIEPHDIIFLTMGAAQAAIQQAFPNHVVAESGCGYEGQLGNTPVCYESEAWRHYQYGRLGIIDGRYYDTTIWNFFDPDDYIEASGGGKYLLFMGRHIARKGLEVVAELAKLFPVVTAGQGDPIPGAEYRGVVSGKEKAELLAGAAAVICATSYVEPGGGIALEAMISGVPVLCSPWGCHSETVSHGESGWHCATMTEFVRGAELALEGCVIQPGEVRDWALDRFTLEAAAPKYDRWLTQLGGLYCIGAGDWYGKGADT